MRDSKKVRCENLTIGELAQRSGVKLETIRYYERIGILAGPPRTTHGHRVYDYEDVRTFVFLRNARQAGFPLAQVRTLLKARAGGASCVEVRDMALDHLAAVRVKIGHLVGLSERLQHAINGCSAEPGGGCPVIEMLDCAPKRDHREYGWRTGLQNSMPPSPARLRDLESRDDSTLVELARAGDASAVWLITKRNNRRLYRVARAVLGDDHEAEDDFAYAARAGYGLFRASTNVPEQRSNKPRIVGYPSGWPIPAVLRVLHESSQARARWEADGPPPE